MSSAAALPPETIHPSLWRASHLARSVGRTVDTGYPALSAELPGGGWPLGALVDLLVQQPGVGEIRLLQPALSTLRDRPIVLLQPPHQPNVAGFAHLGIPTDTLLLVRAGNSMDALWSAEQILRAGSCSALLFWQQHVQATSLRRLHLAAQSSDTLFLMIRPLASVQDSSPAVLRLSVKPALDGIALDIVKRRGPQTISSLSICLQPTHARVSRRSLTPLAARRVPAELAV
jgi:protein ImuA